MGLALGYNSISMAHIALQISGLLEGKNEALDNFVWLCFGAGEEMALNGFLASLRLGMYSGI